MRRLWMGLISLAALSASGCAVDQLGRNLFSGMMGGRTSNEKALNSGGHDIGSASPADGDGPWESATGHNWSP